jgi:cell division initiation protein
VISINPQEIENAQFKTTRLKEGYDPDEVDSFLDRVSEELRAAHAALVAKDTEIQRLKRQCAEQQRMLDEYDRLAPTQALPKPEAAPSASAALVLQAAQETAEKVIAAAEAQARDITAAAEANARDRADEVVAGAYKRRDDVMAKVADMETKLAAHTDTADKARTLLRDMLARLEQ